LSLISVVLVGIVCFDLDVVIFYFKKAVGLDLCADFTVSAAARRSILIDGGKPPVQKIGGRGAAWSAQFSDVAYLYQKFLSKELML